MLSSFIHSVLTFFEGLGYWGIMLGLMIEIIPSEIVLAYAGYLVFNGSISFIGAVVFGTIGGVIAQIFYLLAWTIRRTPYIRTLRKIYFHT